MDMMECLKMMGVVCMGMMAHDYLWVLIGKMKKKAAAK